MWEAILEFVKNIPNIIDSASKSPLGVTALAMIIIGAVTVILFWNQRNPIYRLLAFLSLVSGIVLLALFGSVPPTGPNPGPNNVSCSFPYDAITGKDGDGNGINKITDLAVTLREGNQSDEKSSLLLSYGFYNGSGTWKWSQKMQVELLGQDNLPVDSLPFGVDGSKCVYGAAERRSYSAETPARCADVKSIRVTVSAATGHQGGC